MRMYWRNILRGAKKTLGSYIGASCIISFGVFMYIGTMDTIYNLQGQLETYYQQSRLAEVFAAVSSFPETELAGLESIPGIAAAFGRLEQDVRIVSEQQSEIVTVHLMGYSEQDTVNLIHLSPERPIAGNDFYLGNKMKAAYGYQDGDNLQMLVQGNLVNFTLSGECRSAEYIYTIPPSGSMMPDPELYDIACIDKGYLEELLDMPGTINRLGFLLAPGYSFEDVRYELMSALEPYGATSLIARKDQASYSVMAEQLDILIIQGVLFMVMFITVSVFMLYVILKKMVDQDRKQIGTMKAFGIRSEELISGYLIQGVLIGGIGAVLAGFLAVPYSRMLFSLYVNNFNLPDTRFQIYWSTRVIGSLIAIITGIFAVYTGVRKIAGIAPAEAMRSAGPSQGRMLRLPLWLNQRLHVMHKIGLRSMLRNPFRTFVIVLAIAFPFGVSCVLLSFEGVLERLSMDQFTKVQTYDLQVFLDDYVPYAKAVSAGIQLDGVVKSEAVTSFGVQLKNNNLIQYASLNGFDQDGDLYKIMDWKQVFYEPPDDGLILSKTLADKLRVREGDVLEVSNVLFAPAAITIPVKKIIYDSFGAGCYLSAEGMRNYFNTSLAADMILLKVGTGGMESVKNQLLDTSRVITMVDNDRIREAYQEQIQTNVAMMAALSLATAVCGLILIYNILMINMRERWVEYGTLIILGTTVKEFRKMVVFEQSVYFLLGIVLGLPILGGVKGVIENTMTTDSMNIKMSILPSAFLQSFIICALIIIGAGIATMYKIKRIIPADILKDKE